MKRTLMIPLFVVLSLFVSSTAMAKNIEVRMENDETLESMYCEVYRVDPGEKKRLKRFTLGKKSRNATGRNAKTFRLRVPMASRTISGVSTYFKIKMVCWNSNRQAGNKQWSLVWDHKDRSFDEYYFSGYCSSRSAPCSAGFKKK